MTRLALLGGAALTTDAGASIPRLERKTAGVLAFFALEEACERLARDRDFPSAIALAERIVARDPESELGHRRLVRLHHERGDDAAAVAALRRYERMLKRLELRPSAEVLALRALVRRTRRGRREPGAAADAELQLRLARPPYVARRRLAERAERALANGAAVLLVGERGVGKTRTMLELLAARGAYEIVEGREGDRGVVYATIARALERLVERRRPELPPWVAGELARLAPGGASASPVDDLVLFEAFAHVVAGCRPLLLRPARRGGLPQIPPAGASPVASTCAPSSGAPIVHDGERIGADTTWAAGTHVVRGTVAVQKGATLTIAPCAVVEMKADAQLLVAGPLGPDSACRVRGRRERHRELLVQRSVP